MSSDPLLRAIRAGDPVEQAELLPLLSVERKADRARVNQQLARAFLDAYEARQRPQDLRWAVGCSERAVLLSEPSEEALPVAVGEQRVEGDADAIKAELKEAGLAAANRGDTSRALELFDEWEYAHARHTGFDVQVFDPEILDAVEGLAAPHAFVPDQRPRPDGRMRIAYLMQGLTEVNSVLVRIDRMFAKHHDRSRFDVAYFAADSRSQVERSPDGVATTARFEELGIPLVPAPDSRSLEARLVALGHSIREFSPDLLVTAAAVVTFKNYFVTRLRPAPLTLSLHQGPSPQYTWHTFDRAIAWFLTNLLDCPADCVHIPIEFELPPRDGETEPRRRLRIPDRATVAVSGGRAPKFRDLSFWRAMAELLEAREDLYWLLLGVTETEIAGLVDVIGERAHAKIRFRPWRSDYLKAVRSGDFAVDSYPYGGGIFLIEAMALGLPVVSFEHDYVARYSMNDSSAGPEIVGIPELIVPRGDFAALARTVSRLADDAEYRRALGERCYDHVRRGRGDPARMVRACEAVYAETISTAAPAERSEGRPAPVSVVVEPGRRRLAVTARNRLILVWNRSAARSWLREFARTRFRGRLREIARRF